MWVELILFFLAIHIAYFLAKLLADDKSIPFSTLNQVSTHSRNREIDVFTFYNKKFYTRVNEEKFFSGKVNRVDMALRTNSSAHFVIKKSRWFSKILAYLSLSKPFYLSDNILLFTDEPTLIEEFSKIEIKEIIVEIFSKKKLYDTKKVWIEGIDGDIILHFKLNKKFKKKKIEINNFLELYSKNFSNFYDAINFSKIASTKTSSLAKSLKPLKFFLTFNVVVGFFLTLFYSMILYNDVMDEFKYSIYIGVMSLIFTLFVIFHVFKKVSKSSFKLIKLLQYTVFSFFSVLMLNGWIIKYSNSFLDKSSTEVVKLEVIRKYSSKTGYFVEVKSNNKEIEKLKISYKLYKKTSHFVYAYCREGGLGIAWVEGVSGN